MLTVDHVLARRRGDGLRLTALAPAQRERALALAAATIAAAAASRGETRADFDERMKAIDAAPAERKLLLGLQKLVADRCEFDSEPEVDPPELRRDVFRRAAALRAGLAGGTAFDRAAVLGEVAAERSLDPERVDALLFADLRAAQRLVEFRATTPERLLDDWHDGQAQAVLLRALDIVVDLRAGDAAAYRALFHKLKFLRLLFRLEPLDDGYRLRIDGPFSLFRSVTKYGLQLAMLLPTIRRCCDYRLRARVLWGKDRRSLWFDHEGGRHGGAPPRVRLPEEVEALATKLTKLDCGWRVEPATEVLHLPGVGLCVPDLCFTHEASGARVLFEAMGYWSRDAVWKRVELVEAGLPQRVLFAVSDRLRVSETVLGDDLPGSLLVYKGAISARVVAERLERLRAR